MVMMPSAPDKTYTLCEYAELDGDIEDPYGGDVEDYEICAEELYNALIKVADKIADL